MVLQMFFIIESKYFFNFQMLQHSVLVKTQIWQQQPCHLCE